MFFGLTIEKALLIGLLAALLVGPERLPGYAEALARFTKRAKEYIGTAKSRVKDEMGEDFTDVDWRTLDPRQYDPRRIIREALLDDAPVSPPVIVKPVSAAPPLATGAPGTQSTRFQVGAVAPFDDEAT